MYFNCINQLWCYKICLETKKGYNYNVIKIVQNPLATLLNLKVLPCLKVDAISIKATYKIALCQKDIRLIK